MSSNELREQNFQILSLYAACGSENLKKTIVIEKYSFVSSPEDIIEAHGINRLSRLSKNLIIFEQQKAEIICNNDNKSPR